MSEMPEPTADGIAQTIAQLGQIPARELARIFALADGEAHENLVLERQHQLLEAA